MSASEYKRELLYRKAQGNICRSDYFNKIRSFTNSVIDGGNFLTLDETDGIINSLKDKEVISKTKLKIDHYLQVVELIKNKTSGFTSYLLMDSEWNFCGMYKLKNEFPNEYNFDKLKSDEIRIISRDQSFQIIIDYDYDKIECEYILYR